MDLIKADRELQKQLPLFTERHLLPDHLPRPDELRPARNLAAIFDDCHNYIYANEGLLKEQIFHEMVKLLTMKLYDERVNRAKGLRFGITASEYRSVFAGRPTLFEKRIRHLFAMVCDEYKGMFAEAALRLQLPTLAYVVGRLQYVDLSRTPGDIKGEAFQAFVYRHQRGDRGEFFTPHPLVRLAVEMVAPQPTERIIDPACGSGGFLIQAIAFQNMDPRRRERYIRDCIRGVEFNPDVALSASVRLALEGGTGREILCANSLSDIDHLDGTFDIVLTNPPFGSRGKIHDQRILRSYELAHKWKKSPSGAWRVSPVLLPRQSPEILFVEKCLRLLKPGGRLAIVLPDGLLQNASSGYLRAWLRDQAVVQAVVSIPQEAFVPYGTGIKTSLLFLQKLPPADPARPVFMARIEKIGYDVKGRPVYRRDEKGNLLRGPSGPVLDEDIGKIAEAYRRYVKEGTVADSAQVFTVAQEYLNSRLDVEHYSPDDLQLLTDLRANGAKPLGEIADILTRKDDFRTEPDREIRYIAISDVDARTMQVVSQQKFRAYDAPSRASYRLRRGDIITAISGASTGTAKHAVAFITEEEEGAICSNGFAVIRNVRGVEPLFLLAYMRTDPFLRQVRRLMTGHAIPAISTELLAQVLVPIPPIEEQRRVAQAISRAFSLCREAAALNRETIAAVSRLMLREKGSP